MQQKKKPVIALVAGGDSGEYAISMESSKMIKKNIDAGLFSVYTILINRRKWVHVDENGNEIDVDKNDFSITIDNKKITFDCAFITIHGTPGEDGKLQGYFDLLGIPYTTSGVLPTAITFNKYFCNQLVSHWGVAVARSVKLLADNPVSESELLQKVNLPVFVKPNKGGSSLGTFFVKSLAQLSSCIKAAFEHDDEILIEEYLEGIELTCGVLRMNGEIKSLPITQIISKSEAGFFDFEAKYTKEAADEITPAPVSEDITRMVKKTTEFLYEKLELKGLARMDYIYCREKLYFLEVNITPGMAQTSIVPQQAAVDGIPITTLFTVLINGALRESK
jgi:D-alanine-D-alanine ligase